MEAVVLILTIAFFGMLVQENRRALRDRRRLKHVVYVNGTRGKSSVTRLIDAGLRAGGLRCFCKTTGTLPMTINTAGQEQLLHRRGCANIREQLAILNRAAQEGAEILVLECMAVDPVLQAVSQHRMVHADIGVLTNVRLDHTDVMGGTIPEIAQALSNTIPKGGVLFTAERACFEQLARNARALGTQAVQALPETAFPDGEEGLPDFPENIALALAVCSHLGVDRETALQGMAGYRRDPYALSAYCLPGGAVFVNGMSANDPQSTVMTYESAASSLGFAGKHVILLLNSRRDRPERTAQLAGLVSAIAPAQVWLIGPGSRLLEGRLAREGSAVPQRRFDGRTPLPLDGLDEGMVLFAAGNIAGPGKELMELVKKEGTPVVL